MKVRTAIVSVPASTSNLGSGFDTLGLAVQLYNVITARTPALDSKADSAQSNGVPGPEQSLIETAAEAFFKAAGIAPIDYEISFANKIPIARGLGSSSTIRVGVMAALNNLCGIPITRFRILQIAAELEGHPDNATPAVLGGFTVSARIDGEVRWWRFSVSPKVRLVTLIPKFGIETEKARSLVPNEFSKQDAAHALNRTAAITAAFAKQEYASLKGLFDDRFHQPYREKLIPELRSVIEAGEQAGAVGGWLSGSGSAIMCLTLKNPKAVANAMRAALPDSKILILKPENLGYLNK